MKADLGCVWPTDATPGPYSTRIPFILFPGTLGIAWSKTTVTFGPSSAAIPERTPTVATSAQTINVRRNSPTDSEVRIRFIVTFLSVMWLVVLKALLLRHRKHRRKTSLYLADDRIAECKFQNIPGPVAKDHKAAGNASHYSI